MADREAACVCRGLTNISHNMTSGDNVVTPTGFLANSSKGFAPVTNATFVVYNESKIYAEWVVCEITTILLVVLLLYVIVALTVFQIRKAPYGRYRGERALRAGKRNDRMLTGLTMAAIVFTFLRCFFDVDVIWGRYSEINCRYLKKPKIAMAFIALMFGILTYWLRQRIIYGNVQLKHVVNKFTRFVSVGILGALSVFFFAGLLIFMIQDAGYKPIPPYGCSESTNIIPFALVALTIFLSQITLVLLLVYPILKRKRNASIKSKKGLGKQKKLMKLVWKAFVTALVAVVTNFFALLIVAFVPTQVDDIGMLIVDVNLTILVFCTILSNAECKKRLFPFRQVKRADLELSTAASIRSSSSYSKTTPPLTMIDRPEQVTPEKTTETNGRQDIQSKAGKITTDSEYSQECI